MFKKIINKFQQQHYSQTWQQTMRNREVIKNSYRTSGDVKKAKTFATHIANYLPHTHFVEHGEHIIFSQKSLALVAEPAYFL